MSHCKVRLLDESDIEIGVNLHGNGQELLESVCKYLNIVEIDYFGLKYKGANYEGLWVRADKPIKKQYPVHPIAWEFTFAVKYYPTDPVYLKEEITKYQLCLQIREDLMSGSLHCPLDILVTLSSYWLQSEFGDDEQQSSEVKRYLMSLKYIPGAERPTPEFEEKVEKLYKSRRGMPPSDADTQFLRLAAALPMYGLQRYATESKDGSQITIAVGSAGVFVMKDKEKPIKYKWSNIKNINYKKETFYMKILSPKKKGHSEKLIYHLKSSLLAKAMWREAVDQHVFFRVTCSDASSSGRTPSGTPQAKKNKGISKRKRKHSFRLSFRKKRPKTEAEVREKSLRIQRPNPAVIRHSSLKRSSSAKSEPSTNSFDSSSVSERKSPRTPPLKSILKPHQLPKGSNEEDPDELDGRPFTNEDFVIEETSETEEGHPNSTLLLTETIPEEDEEGDAERRSTTSKEFRKSPDATPTKESLPINENLLETPMVVVSSAEDEIPEVFRPKVTVEVCDEQRNLSKEIPKGKTSSPKVTVEVCDEQRNLSKEIPKGKTSSPKVTVEVCDEQRNLSKEIPKGKTSSPKVTVEVCDEQRNLSKEIPKGKTSSPKVTVEVCDEPRKLSMDLRPNSSRSEFLPPPLLSQSTREAIIPYYQEEKRAADEPDASTIAEEVLEANYVQGHSKSKMKHEEAEDLLEDNTPSEKSKISFPELELPRNGGGKPEDDEDDRRTIGGASAVAILGDDEDPNMKDLVDDVMNYFTDYDKGQFRVMEQNQDETESRITESSKSSISNLTDNTEELCSPNILDIIWSKCSGGKDYRYREIFGVKLRKVRGRSRQCKSTIFDVENHHSVGTQIPTPPPADDSVIKTQSSKFSFSSNRNKYIPSWPFDPDSVACNTDLDELDKEAIKAALRAQQELETDLNGFDYLPSSGKYHTPDSTKSHNEEKFNVSDTVPEATMQRADSIPGIPLFCRSVLKSLTDSNTSSRRDSNASTAPSTTQKETLVYPPDIQTYQNKVKHDIEVLKYQPKVDAELVFKNSERLIPGSSYSEKVTETTTAAPSVAEDVKKRSNHAEMRIYSDYRKPLFMESEDSGRSTPSSDTSFPQFVHSVYPLRKMSTNWGSETTCSQETLSDKVSLPAMAEENSDQESSTTVSNCSIRSVRGSIDDSNESSFEDPPESDVFPASQITEVTVLEFINESIVTNGEEELTIRQELTETSQHINISSAQYNGAVEDYSEEAMVDSDESSSMDTKSRDTLPYEELNKDLVFQEAERDSSRIEKYVSESSPGYPSVSDNRSSSAQSCTSSETTDDNWTTLSLDLSEIIPTTEQSQNGPINVPLESQSTLSPQGTSSDQVQEQNDKTSMESTSMRDDNELPEDDQIHTEHEEREIAHSSKTVNPIIVISSEQSEGDEINDAGDDNTSTSSNSQDTCEYNFNPILDDSKEQQDEVSPHGGDKENEESEN